jgi:hypothetical protein
MIDIQIDSRYQAGLPAADATCCCCWVADCLGMGLTPATACLLGEAACK